MAQRPPRDLDWVPDDITGINVPSQAKQNGGWLVEKPARQFFNWMWNRLSRWTHYFSGQSQEWIVIDSSQANEKDYDTLAAYIADSPASGDKVLVKETQILTAQMVIPSNITLRILDGINFTRATNEATSVIKFSSKIIVEGVLEIVLNQTGIIAKAVEFDGNNVVGKINVENSSTGTLTTAFHINAAKSANNVNGVAQNTGGGILTNAVIDNAAEDTNLLTIYDEPNDQIVRSLGSNTFFDGFKFKLGSDADGDIYYRDAGILKKLAIGGSNTYLRAVAGLPEWSSAGRFLGGLEFDLGSDADGDIYYRDTGILKRLAKGTDKDILVQKAGIPSWETLDGAYTPSSASLENIASVDSLTATFMRIGDLVTVFFRITATPTAGAGTETNLTISIPIAVDFTASGDLYGSGVTKDIIVGVSPFYESAIISADPSNDGADIHFKAQNTNRHLIQGSFSYRVS